MAERLAKEDLTPLQIMVDVMCRHYKAERFDEAARVAKDAAPYMHAKLAAIEVTGKDRGPLLVKAIGADASMSDL